MLVALALVSLGLSALPWAWAASLALLIVLRSLWQIRRDLQSPRVRLRIADDGAWVVLLRPQLPPLLLHGAEIGLRGPLAWVRAREPEGRRRAWLWLPDQANPEGMRKLRLACAGRNAKSASSLATMPG